MKKTGRSFLFDDITMNITCLDKHLPLPDIPDFANHTNRSYHPSYEPKSGGALAGLISSSIIQSVFSLNDLRSFLHRLVIEQSLSSDVSEVIKYSSVASVLTYTIVAFCLCLFFSLAFCTVSCFCRRSRRRSGSFSDRSNRKSTVGIYLLFFLYLLLIGDMIYLVIRIHKTDKHLDKTIETLNEEIYPKDISEHLIYLRSQIDQLDRYCTEPNSILINASKSIVLETFDQILNQKYFLSTIVQKTGDSDRHFQQLANLVRNDPSISPTAQTLFQTISLSHQNLLKSLSDPLKKLCEYEFVTTTDVDRALLKALDDVHLELARLRRFINDDVLRQITPWEDHQLIDLDKEDDIRKYLHLANVLFLVLCIVVVVVPLTLFAIICIGNSRSSRTNRTWSGTEDDDVAMDDLDGSYMDQSPKAWKEVRMLSKKRSNGPRCCIRVIFGLMIVVFLILTIVSGAYYGLNMFVQSSCQLAHEDQPFLVSLITDDTKVNETIINVIDDCRNQVHFSQTFLRDYSVLINETIATMMDILNDQIYNQFKSSIGQITIPNDIDQLILLANLTNRPDISAQVKLIDGDLNAIEELLVRINQTDTNLPPNLIQQTTTEFWNYLNGVLESTIDACPLPVEILLRTDQLICHDLGHSINGLWLSVFLFVTFVIFGLWTFSLLVC